MKAKRTIVKIRSKFRTLIVIFFSYTWKNRKLEASRNVQRLPFVCLLLRVVQYRRLRSLNFGANV